MVVSFDTGADRWTAFRLYIVDFKKLFNQFNFTIFKLSSLMYIIMEHQFSLQLQIVTSGSITWERNQNYIATYLYHR